MSDIIRSAAEKLVVKTLGVNKRDKRRGYIVLAQEYKGPNGVYTRDEFPILSFWRFEKGGEEKPTGIEQFLRQHDLAPKDAVTGAGVRFSKSASKPDNKGNVTYYENWGLEEVHGAEKLNQEPASGWRSLAGIKPANEAGDVAPAAEGQ
jgi:hypothetical protein